MVWPESHSKLQHDGSADARYNMIVEPWGLVSRYNRPITKLGVIIIKPY